MREVRGGQGRVGCLSFSLYFLDLFFKMKYLEIISPACTHVGRKKFKTNPGVVGER
jgi:hypothetical protein